MWLLALTGCFLLVGLDMRITYVRVKHLGPSAEMNPLIRWAFRTEGLQAGLAALLLLNCGVITAAAVNTNLLCMLFGAKLGLMLLQLKSLYREKPNV